MNSSGDQNTKQEQISSKHSKEAVAYKFWQEFQEERKGTLYNGYVFLIIIEYTNLFIFLKIYKNRLIVFLQNQNH